MRRHALLLFLSLLATPAAAAEIACEGAFAPDSSVARLEEVFGADNVVTGDAPGPEGTTILATTVFPDDPAKKMVFGWWDEEALAELSYVELPASDSVAGVRAGMSVAEVEALNGEPFTMTGFWWDYGGYAGFQSGKLADQPGGCYLSLSFEPQRDAPDGTDVGAISGDQQVPSTEPLLTELDVRVIKVTLGYPYPNLEEFEETPPAADDAGPAADSADATTG